jgi:hypothetical protein
LLKKTKRIQDALYLSNQNVFISKSLQRFFLFPSQENEGKEKSYSVCSQAAQPSSAGEMPARRLPASLAKPCRIEQAAVAHRDTFNSYLPTNSVKEPVFA